MWEEFSEREEDSGERETTVREVLEDETEANVLSEEPEKVREPMLAFNFEGIDAADTDTLTGDERGEGATRVETESEGESMPSNPPSSV